MKISDWLKIKIRPFMRPLISFFLYFIYETPHIIGNSGKLIKGKKVVVNNTLFNLSSGSIIIGDFSFFGYNVMVLTGTHRFSDGQRLGLQELQETDSWGAENTEVPKEGLDIIIGSGTWICSGATILGGVKIGNNAIISSGSLVTKDVPDYGIFAGVPGKLIGDTRNL